MNETDAHRVGGSDDTSNMRSNEYSGLLPLGPEDPSHTGVRGLDEGWDLTPDGCGTCDGSGYLANGGVLATCSECGSVCVGDLCSTMETITPHEINQLADVVSWTAVHGYQFPAEDVVGALRFAADRLEAVQAVIENAPHEVYPSGVTCPAQFSENEPCSCWKAEVL